MTSSLASAIGSALNLKKPKAMEDDEEVVEDTITDDDDDTVAEGEDDDPDAEEDDEENTAEDDDEETKASSYRKGYAAALNRTAAILTTPEADANPEQAAKLAFGKQYQNLSAKACVGILKTAPKPAKKSGLADRMTGNKHGLGPDGEEPQSSYENGSLNARMDQRNRAETAKLKLVK